MIQKFNVTVNLEETYFKTCNGFKIVATFRSSLKNFNVNEQNYRLCSVFKNKYYTLRI